MSLECGKTLDKLWHRALQVGGRVSYKSCLGKGKKIKIHQNKKAQKRITKTNTKDCPLVLKENAAGILSVVNAAAVQLESFYTAQMKQLFTQFFSARGYPLVPLRLRHLFPPTAPVTSDPSGLSVLCIYAQS